MISSFRVLSAVFLVKLMNFAYAQDLSSTADFSNSSSGAGNDTFSSSGVANDTSSTGSYAPGNTMSFWQALGLGGFGLGFLVSIVAGVMIHAYRKWNPTTVAAKSDEVQGLLEGQQQQKGYAQYATLNDERKDGPAAVPLTTLPPKPASAALAAAGGAAPSTPWPTNRSLAATTTATAATVSAPAAAPGQGQVRSVVDRFGTLSLGLMKPPMPTPSAPLAPTKPAVAPAAHPTGRR